MHDIPIVDFPSLEEKQKFENNISVERAKDKINFYISSYKDIKSFFKIHSLNTSQYDIKNLEKLTEKQQMHNGILNHFQLKTNSFIFEGPGGLGKTKQLFDLYDSNELISYNKEIAFSKYLDKLLVDQNFLNFISGNDNLLLIDALNEAKQKDVENLFKLVKCKLIATTRPLKYVPWSEKSIKIKLYNSIDYYEFIEKFGIPANLPMNLMGFIGELQTRDFVILLTASQIKSKSDKNPKNLTPLSKIRSLYEKYINSLEKLNGVPKGTIWYFIKSNNGLSDYIEKESISNDDLKNIYKKTVKKNIDFKIIKNLLLENNIIQTYTDGNYIISNKNLMQTLKFTKEIFCVKPCDLNVKMEKLIKEKYNDDYSKLRTLFLAEIIIRRYINSPLRTKINVREILEEFSNLSKVKERPKSIRKKLKIAKRINYKKQNLYNKKMKKHNKKMKNHDKNIFWLDLINKKYYQEDDNKIKSLFQSLKRDFMAKKIKNIFNNHSFDSYFESVSIYTWMNSIGLASDFIKISDDKMIYKLAYVHGDLGRINISSLIMNFKLPNFFFEFDKDSFSNETHFSTIFSREKVHKANTKILVKYLTYGYSSITRSNLNLLIEKYGLSENKILRMGKKETIRYSFWYFLNCSSDDKGEFKYPRKFRRMYKLNKYSNFYKNNKKDSIQNLIKDLRRMASIKNVHARLEWFQLCRDASYNQDILSFWEMEHLLIDKLDANDLFWFFMERLYSLEKSTEKSPVVYRHISENDVKPIKIIDTLKANVLIRGPIFDLDVSNFLTGEFYLGDEKVTFSSTNSNNSYYCYYSEPLKFSLDSKIKEVTSNSYQNGVVVKSKIEQNFVIFNYQNIRYRFNRIINEWEVFTEEKKMENL